MEFHILCGIPGSGKSTLVRQLPGLVVSTDSLRKFLWHDENFMDHDKLVFKLVDEIITYMLAKKEDVVFDATNLVRKRRQKYIRLAKELGAVVILHWVNTPLQTAMERNHQRERRVPIKVIKSLYFKMQQPELSEGMDIIHIYSSSLELMDTIRDVPRH